MKTGSKLISVLLALLLVCSSAAVGLTSFAIDGTAEPTVKAINCEGEITVQYKETRAFEFEAQNLPAGAEVYIFLNGEKLRADTYVTVTEPTADYTVEGRALDESGQTVASSGVIRVHVQNGISDRVQSFFHRTLGSFFDGIADVIASFFVKILFFLFNR